MEAKEKLVLEIKNYDGVFIKLNCIMISAIPNEQSFPIIGYFYNELTQVLFV